MNAFIVSDRPSRRSRYRVSIDPKPLTRLPRGSGMKHAAQTIELRPHGEASAYVSWLTADEAVELGKELLAAGEYAQRRATR